MHVYSDEDNTPMTYDFLLEYTGKITAVINDRLFKETGILEITHRAEGSAHMRGTETLKHIKI